MKKKGRGSDERFAIAHSLDFCLQKCECLTSSVEFPVEGLTSIECISVIGMVTRNQFGDLNNRNFVLLLDPLYLLIELVEVDVAQ